MPYPVSDMLDVTCPVNWADPLTRGLVAWWMAVPANGWVGGRTVRDLVRGGRTPNDGTATNMAFPATATSGWGPTARPGGFGEVRFDGSNDYVDCGDPASLALSTGNFTLSAWVNATAGSAASVVARGNNPVTRLASLDLAGGGAPGQIQFQLYDGANNPFARHASDIRGTGWRHVVGVRQSGTLRLFVGGVQTATATDTAGDVGGGTGSIWAIGRRLDSNYVTGSIDDVRIHNRALSAAEVAAVYADSNTGYRRTLNWVETRAWAAGTATNRRRRYLTLGAA